MDETRTDRQAERKRMSLYSFALSSIRRKKKKHSSSVQQGAARRRVAWRGVGDELLRVLSTCNMQHTPTGHNIWYALYTVIMLLLWLTEGKQKMAPLTNKLMRDMMNHKWFYQQFGLGGGKNGVAASIWSPRLCVSLLAWSKLLYNVSPATGTNHHTPHR